MGSRCGERLRRQGNSLLCLCPFSEKERLQFCTHSLGDLGTSISSFIKEGRWEGVREGDGRGKGGRGKKDWKREAGRVRHEGERSGEEQPRESLRLPSQVEILSF